MCLGYCIFLFSGLEDFNSVMRNVLGFETRFHCQIACMLRASLVGDKTQATDMCSVSEPIRQSDKRTEVTQLSKLWYLRSWYRCIFMNFPCFLSEHLLDQANVNPECRYGL